MGWNSIFEKSGRVFLTPHKAMPEIAKYFKEKNVRKILDFGCGTGRHVVYLAEQGFQVYGMDSASEGIRLAGEWLKGKGLKAELTVASMFDRLLYETDYFDAVVCTRVLNHGYKEDIQKVVSELERVLKPNGLVFIEIRKPPVPLDPISKYTRPKVIGPRTLIYTDGPEKDVIHYQFSKAILLKMFHNFIILRFWLQPEKEYTSVTDYYCFVGELKTKEKTSF